MGNNCSEKCENYGKPGCKCALKARRSLQRATDENEKRGENAPDLRTR